MTRSPTKESTPLVMPITIKALGTQWPGWALFQKKEMGVHWRRLEVKAATAQHFEDLRQATVDTGLTALTAVNTHTPIQTRLKVWVRNKRA